MNDVRIVERDGRQYRVVTRVTSTMHCAPASEQSARDYDTVERFEFDNGRRPAPGDGAAHEALLRQQRRNLGAQLTREQLPGETERLRSWRRSTAVRMLARLALPASPPPAVPVAQGRRLTLRERRSRSSSRARAPSRPADADPHLDPPGVAGHFGVGRP